MADPSDVLAGALLRSVDPEGDEDAAEAWVAELDLRSASVENGTAQIIDAAAAHAHVLGVLRARRASRR
jgi:hypothetical protein